VNDTKRPAKSKSASSKSYEGFTDGERAVMKDRATELKGTARRGSRPANADDEIAVLAKIAEMPDHDRILGERLHAIIKASAPGLSPETLVRNARLCRGRQARLPLPACAEVQDEVRDTRLQRQCEPRRRRRVAGRLCPDRTERRRRGKDR
jgi:hypothetical protein